MASDVISQKSEPTNAKTVKLMLYPPNDMMAPKGRGHESHPIPQHQFQQTATSLLPHIHSNVISTKNQTTADTHPFSRPVDQLVCCFILLARELWVDTWE
jgi:hypothetical protein